MSAGKVWAGVLLLLVLGSRGGAAEPAIPASQAGKHVGETCTIDFVVNSTGTSKKEGLLFLNSEENFRAKTNFAVVFDRAAIARFKTAGIDDLEKHYFGKRIRATGPVRHFKSMTDIRVEDPKQIVMVEPGTPEPAPAEPAAPPAVVTAAAEEAVPATEDTVPTWFYYAAAGGVALLVVGFILGRTARTSAAPM